MFFLYFIYLVTFCEGYSREDVQETHPGFGKNWVMIEGNNGSYTFGYLRQNSRKVDLTYPEPRTVVNFTLFTRETREGVKVEDIGSLGARFDPTKPSKFLTHGWLSSGRSDMCVTIKDGFLERYDVNVFIMDWSEISTNILYPVAMMATKSVGDFYAEFVNQLVDFGVNPDDIHFVGHSLGAHVSGFAARGAKSKVARITGLDPALPGFNRLTLVSGDRLNKDDAQFVDIIHTCSGYLGMSDPIGHADFFPNGGNVPQPGCEVVREFMEGCSHGMSWKLFAASLKKDNFFHSVECRSLEQYTTGLCSKDTILMGDPAPSSARGYFYLQTAPKEPYAMEYHKAERW